MDKGIDIQNLAQINMQNDISKNQNLTQLSYLKLKEVDTQSNGISQQAHYKSPKKVNDEIKVSQASRKILETVLRNSFNLKIPQTITQFTELCVNILENEEQKDFNVAHILRSLADQMKFDIKIEKLILDVLKFSIKTRTFQKDKDEELNENKIKDSEQKSGEFKSSDIGRVTLGKFLLEFGKLFHLFDFSNESICKILKLTPPSCKISNNGGPQYLKFNDEKAQLTLNSFMSPIVSQKHLSEAKLFEASQITKIFENSELRQLKQKENLFDTSQQLFGMQDENQKQDQKSSKQGGNDNADELMANEDLGQINNFANMRQQRAIFNPQKRFPEYSGLSSLLSQSQKLINLQKSQQKAVQLNTSNKNQTPIKQKVDQTNYNIQKLEQLDQSSLENRLFDDLNNQHNLLFKLPQEKSLISANNSYFNTPIKPTINQLYPNHSSFKPKSSNKLLFNQANNNMNITNPTLNSLFQESPKFLPINQQNILRDGTMAARALCFSANKVHPSMQSPQLMKQNSNLLGSKRFNVIPTNKLETKVYQDKDPYLMDGFQTPLQKRMKIDPSSSLTKGSHYPKNEDSLDNQNTSDSEEDEEEEKDTNGNNKNNENVDGVEGHSSASRKKRGLKILSVKVQELVFQKQSTTYKDVANELIKQLRDKRKAKELGGLDGCESGEDSGCGEDDEMSDCESPNKQSERDASSSQQKWEKNVRRRVYDALNVLYAAGVLKKEGKHVSCDKQVLQLTNKFKSSKQNSNEKNPSSAQSSAAKGQRNQSVLSVQDQKLIAQIENLKQQIVFQKSKVDQKRSNLFEQFKHFISYKNLIERNKSFKDKGFYIPQKSISLPFILVATKDCPENEVEISFGDHNRTLNIAMKKPMKCIGDADTLIKLGLYKVQEEFISSKIIEGQNILKCLTPSQRSEILI